MCGCTIRGIRPIEPLSGSIILKASSHPRNVLKSLYSLSFIVRAVLWTRERARRIDRLIDQDEIYFAIDNNTLTALEMYLRSRDAGV